MASGRTRRRLWLIPVAGVMAAAVVVAARILREQPAVRDFVDAYDGIAPTPADAPIGIPLWLAIVHGLNIVLMVLVVRTGWIIRTDPKSAGFWSPRRQKPGRPPMRIGLKVWAHLTLDVVWVAAGVVYVVLLFASGHWMRIVPTSLEVVPQALSAGLQYASMEWPTENGWTHYNALQQISYFATVFVAAPLAILSGLRMSPAWPGGRVLDRLVPLTLSRRLHLPVMVYFVAFTLVHVTLVLATGAVRNLNHMFAVRDDETWWGVVVVTALMGLVVAAWFVWRPVVIRSLAGLVGKVSR